MSLCCGTKSFNRQRRFGTALALVCAGCWLTVVPLMAQSLWIGDHVALPGGSVKVPVSLDNAAGVAALGFIVNYDSELLRLASVEPDILGMQFGLEQKIEEGRVVVALVREDALASGSGALVHLRFNVNPGAVPGMASPVVLADRGASGVYAVDLFAGANAAPGNGTVRVVSIIEDSDADGLPDWWEEAYFGGPVAAGATLDPDADGMNNSAEFRAGTIPTNSVSLLRLHVSFVPPSEVRLTFASVLGRRYRIQISEDLVVWEPLGEAIPATNEIIEVVHAITGTRFFRVLVVP